MPFAGVAELVDARDLGSRDESRGGSSPSARTISAPVGTTRQSGQLGIKTMQVTETLAEGLKATAGAYTRTRLTPAAKRLFGLWFRLTG